MGMQRRDRLNHDHDEDEQQEEEGAEEVARRVASACESLCILVYGWLLAFHVVTAFAMLQPMCQHLARHIGRASIFFHGHCYFCSGGTRLSIIIYGFFLKASGVVF